MITHNQLQLRPTDNDNDNALIYADVAVTTYFKQAKAEILHVHDSLSITSISGHARCVCVAASAASTCTATMVWPCASPSWVRSICFAWLLQKVTSACLWLSASMPLLPLIIACPRLTCCGYQLSYPCCTNYKHERINGYGRAFGHYSMCHRYKWLLVCMYSAQCSLFHRYSSQIVICKWICKLELRCSR